MIGRTIFAFNDLALGPFLVKGYLQHALLPTFGFYVRLKQQRSAMNFSNAGNTAGASPFSDSCRRGYNALFWVQQERFKVRGFGRKFSFCLHELRMRVERNEQ